MTAPADTPRYPVRPPAAGPAAILDHTALYRAVRDKMNTDGMTLARELSDATGLDRNSVSRFLARGRVNTIITGQRGGLSVNAYLTLVTWLNNGQPPAPFATIVRPLPAPTAAQE